MKNDRLRLKDRKQSLLKDRPKGTEGPGKALKDNPTAKRSYNEVVLQ